MAKFIVTIFPDAKSPKEAYHKPVELIVKRIREGSSKFKIAQIRSCIDPKEKSKLKLTLPSICFSGIFNERKNESLEKHSGLVAIDFDHLGKNIDIIRDRLKNDPYTMILFTSPSGDGLKLVVKIPPSVKTHDSSCRALTEYYNEDKLDEFRDVARICFESYDPDIFTNYDSKVFTALKEDHKKKNHIPKGDYIHDFDDIYLRIKKWIDSKGEYYSDGNKHSFLVKLSSACLRFNIPEGTTSKKLIFEYATHPGCESVNPQDIDNIVNAVYKNYNHTAGTAHFEMSGNPKMNDESDFDLSKIDISIPLKDIIYLDAVRDEMLNNFRTGLNIGETTHFVNSIDNHYRLKRGELTLFHGIGNHGKSTFLMQLLLIKSIKDGYKWAVFSPEQNPPSDFYNDLVHMYIGKNILPQFNDQMSEEEFNNGMDFIKEHFFYIYPEDEAPTPDYINSRFLEVLKKHKVDGCVIDPYNQLDNDISKAGGREDLYLSAFLTKQKRLAQKHDLFMFIVSHPKGGLTKTVQGDYNEPNIYDLSGGAMWGNKCDNIICIYRPVATTDKASVVTKFISQKIKKQKLCGRPGEVTCYLDLVSMRYKAEGLITKYKDGKAISTNSVLDEPFKGTDPVKVNEKYVEQPDLSFEMIDNVPF